MKQCLKCWTEKQLIEFNKNKCRKDWYRDECRSCQKVLNHIYYCKRHNINKSLDFVSKREVKWIVYILESQGIYKIGLTKWTMFRRLASLQTGNPYEINIIKQYKTNYLTFDEKLLHDKFNNKRFRWEWFNLNKTDLEYIEDYFTNIN
jgi:hypothetical protein